MLLHIIDDIKRLGSPQNTNGGPCESNFKPQKRESARTQRRAHIFHEQMATRIYEQQIIRRSIDVAETIQTDKDRPDKLVSGARFKIMYSEESMEYELNWNRPTYKRSIYGEDVIEFVYQIFFQNMEDNKIQCFTEHRVNDVIFRADCSYRGDMEWYDWAHILWDSPDEDTNDSISILGRIHMFVDCRKHVFHEIKHVNGIDIPGGDVYAVISSLTWKQPTKMGVSVLFFKGKLEKHRDDITYYIVPASALDSTAIVIHDIEKDSYNKNENDVIVMTTCDEWKYRFDDMYEDQL